MADLQLPNTVEEEGTETGRICESKDRRSRVIAALSYSQGKGKGCLVKIIDSSEESKKMRSRIQKG